jgi:octaprenyl-diphosphate synthase
MKELSDVFLKLSPDLKKIDQIILDFAVGKSPLIAEISKHLISSGGKRIRPVLLLLSAQVCGAKIIEKHHNLAAAVELIHSATLLHDDVVDTSEVRRGKKTANAIWDNKSSILVGDYLFSIAFQLMVRCQNLRALDLLSKASSVMADGEVMQLENSTDVALSKEKYLEIIFGKTAILFSAACEAGAIISSYDESKIAALREFGKNLGIIFQIVDDLLDYSSQENVLGKDVGNDFFEGKVTLPIILTFERANEAERTFIEQSFTKNLLGSDRNLSDLAAILALIEKHKGFEAARNLASHYQKLAMQNLEIFSNEAQKKNLVAILDYSLSRIF